ncbi:cytidine deaminase [Synechococcus elongatus]|nr:cytidine deaminase [Synechococcus elongatus PCC 11801]
MQQNEEIAMKLDQALVDAAIALLEQRFPRAEGIAAAAYTDDGQILTSVVFEPEWGGGGLCAETGAICEAVKLDKRITALVCVSRLSGDSPIVILTPCGICQERLFHWGESVEVATPTAQDASRWIAKTLGEVQPYYWAKAFKE